MTGVHCMPPDNLTRILQHHRAPTGVPTATYTPATPATRTHVHSGRTGTVDYTVGHCHVTAMLHAMH